MELPGYRGRSQQLLKSSNVAVGDLVVVKVRNNVYEGTLLPRYEYADDQHIAMKLANGYNVGISINNIVTVKRIRNSKPPRLVQTPLPDIDNKLPRIALISTGGTIASKIDYRTGGVVPALSTADLHSLVPELSNEVRVESEEILNLLSENVRPEHWTLLAQAVERHVASGVKGVVIAHGTDTMGYTAAALSFALLGVPIPVIFVGSQRSSDRPSSDANLNLVGAARIASQASFSGVYVAMHIGLSDDMLAIHLGTRTRKNHTSRRDAFQSVNSEIAATVKDKLIEKSKLRLPGRGSASNFQARSKFDDRVALVKFYPALDPELFGFLIQRGVKGIIIEGTGLGHVSAELQKAIKTVIDSGVIVGMTSQCVWGRVRMSVYDTGRDLLKIGVIPLDDMLAETALVKMMWLLGYYKRPKEIASTLVDNLAGEISPRSPLRVGLK